MPRRRCLHEGCRSFAQSSPRGTGKAGFCIKHGGGDRCEEPECSSSAQSSPRGTGKAGFCKKHGGGDRCQEPGCSSSAAGSPRGTGKAGFCKKHGGGDRCEEQECSSSTVGSPRGTGKAGFCKKHGGGSSICAHGRQRSTCKDCGGSSICAHGRQRNKCKDCGGSSVCAHGRQRSQCKDCGGSSICDHGRIRSTCKDCGGSSICDHGRIRSTCKDCGGSSICDHGRRRSQCKDCGGSSICRGHREHSSGCETLGNRQYDGYCTECFRKLFPGDPRSAGIRRKTKETLWVSSIVSELPEQSWTWDKPLYVDFEGGCCATKRRVDLRVLVEHAEAGLFWLCVEIDEGQHRAYPPGYEDARYNDLFVDFSGRYVFVRVNPDSFLDAGGRRVDPDFAARLTAVVGMLHRFLQEGPRSAELVEVHHCFYDEPAEPVLISTSPFSSEISRVSATKDTTPCTQKGSSTLV